MADREIISGAAQPGEHEQRDRQPDHRRDTLFVSFAIDTE